MLSEGCSELDCAHVAIHPAVVRPSFAMMTITSSMMMMMMSCLVDPVGAEMANQSNNSGLQHSSTLGAWVCRAG